MCWLEDGEFVPTSSKEKSQFPARHAASYYKQFTNKNEENGNFSINLSQ